MTVFVSRSFPWLRGGRSGRAGAVLWGCAWLALAVGLLVSARTVLRAGDVGRRLKSRQAEVDQLTAMQRSVDRHRAAVGMYEGLTNRSPVDLSAMLRALCGEQGVEIREREAREVGDKWRLRRVEVVLTEVPLIAVGAFLPKAEGHIPPWRLTECTLNASRTREGATRAVLVLEGLEKTP